jgi:hypothetical protein
LYSLYYRSIESGVGVDIGGHKNSIAARTNGLIQGGNDFMDHQAVPGRPEAVKHQMVTSENEQTHIPENMFAMTSDTDVQRVWRRRTGNRAVFLAARLRGDERAPYVCQFSNSRESGEG